MKVVVYYRQPQDPSMAEIELATQGASVAEWMAQQKATIEAEFSETETGTNRRPVFGRARQAARRAGATLLVATTKALGTSDRFEPADTDSTIPIRCLADPAERVQELWQRSERLVVYYRTVASDDEATRLSLEQQRGGVVLIVHPGVHTILAEFTEVETGRAGADGDAAALDPALGRPKLAEALDLCRREKARLVIGTTDAIGTAPAFMPDTGDVPTEIAWRAADAWDAVVPAPTEAAAPFLGLHLGQRFVRNRRSLYLANRMGIALVDVTIRRSGWTSAYGELVELEPSETALDHVADGTSRLAGDYDVFSDSDFILTWTIRARDDAGQLFVGTVTLDKGAPTGRLLPVRDWQQVEDVEPTRSADPDPNRASGPTCPPA